MPSGEAVATVPVLWRAMRAAARDPASPFSILCCSRAVPGEKCCFSPRSSPLIGAAEELSETLELPLALG